MTQFTHAVTCLVCKQDFHTHKLNVKFCSVRCRKSHNVALVRAKRGAVDHIRSCFGCGAEFATRRTNQKFCSPQCRTVNNQAETKAKRETARIKVRECPGCGTAFEPVGRQRFCSLRCGQRIQARARLGIVDPGRIRDCWWCGEEFVLLNALQLYCSKECGRFVKSLWNLGKYGITRDDYREAWYRQDGRCAICRQPERSTRNHLLSVDHDHATGRFRALLCSDCNRAIGMFSDDPAHLRSAADYIERHRAALTI